MNKKTLIVIVGAPLITALFAWIFYQMFFLRPLAQNQELFPQNSENKTKEIKAKPKVSPEAIASHGITLEQIADFQGEMLFIDGREDEEYANNHLQNSAHLRTMDIKKAEIIKKSFDIDEDKFQSTMFVLYCHDGTRSAEMAEKLNLKNLKFLVGGVGALYENKTQNPKLNLVVTGVPAIETEIQQRDFSIDLETALDAFEKEQLFIDGRFEKTVAFLFARNYRIGALDSEQYAQVFAELSKIKNEKLVYLADAYGDLFYAKLLAQRMNKELNYPLENFQVLFNQSEEFQQKLKDTGKI